ncbi:MAG: hypothetical protein JSW28_01210, partial [Thermoplasmata archaeon]
MRGDKSEKVLRAVSMVIILNMALGGFLGLLVIEPGAVMVAEGYPTTTNEGDIIIDGDIPGEDNLTIDNLHFKQDGDIIVRDNGELHINNAILEFLVDTNESNRHKLTIENGGKVYMKNAKITISTRDLENYETAYWFNNPNAKFLRPLMFYINVTGGTSEINLVNSELAYHGYLIVDAGTAYFSNSKTTRPYAPKTGSNWGVVVQFLNGATGWLEDSRIEHSPPVQGVMYDGGLANPDVMMYDYHKVVDSNLYVMNTYFDIDFTNRYNPTNGGEYSPATGFPDDVSPNTPENNTNPTKNMLWIEGTSEVRLYGLTVNMDETGGTVDPVYGQTAIYIADDIADVNLYRWLVVKPVDSVNVPVANSTIQVVPMYGDPKATEIITLNNPTLPDNSRVKAYLERTTDATITQNGNILQGVTGPSGRLIFAVVTDMITPEDMPNSLFVGNYNITATYINTSVTPIIDNITYGNAGSEEYPFITESDNYFYPNMTAFKCKIPAPDLYANFAEVLPSTLVTNETLAINVTVTNWKEPGAPGVNVSNVRVEIWDGDPDVNTSQRIGSKIIPVIWSNTSVTVTINWTPTERGDYTLYVYVDRDNENPFNDNLIPELDETNNMIDPPPTVKVLGRPELYIESIALIADASELEGNYILDGASVSLKARVRNNGEASVPFVSVSFWLGTPGTSLIGYNNITQLAGNGGVKTPSVPWVAVEGTYKIYVAVDWEDNVTELDEDNNTV